ncbi:MAG: SPFH domain-containing protein [Mucilaginibacter sp.]|nr:SPFH domain-containing protein [Mucilaginibacter sp.]
MNAEKILEPTSGFGAAGLIVLLAIIAIVAPNMGATGAGVTIICLVIGVFILPGFVVVNPNESKVLTFFGKYVGTVKQDGFFWVNPFTVKKKVSLRAFNLNGQQLKVNDSVGNPIEIAAVIVWQIKNTASAVFAVENYLQYVNIQSEAAVRHLANSFPYDNIEDENAGITLRGGADQVSILLEKELNERLDRAGIEVLEARISHLAYAPEIAHTMLQRQQASAIISARRLIVEGAVGMVEMALQRLSEKNIVDLDEERKAAMVSNLLVVLCGDRSVNPVVNTGTLYH